MIFPGQLFLTLKKFTVNQFVIVCSKPIDVVIGSGAMTTDSTGSATPPHVDEEGEMLPRAGREEEEMSELSEESGKDWKPDMTGKLAWLHR